MEQKYDRVKIAQDMLEEILKRGNQTFNRVSLATGYFDQVASEAWDYLINKGLIRKVSGQNRDIPDCVSYEANV